VGRGCGCGGVKVVDGGGAFGGGRGGGVGQVLKESIIICSDSYTIYSM
jgi:hypothetical protein